MTNKISKNSIIKLAALIFSVVLTFAGIGGAGVATSAEGAEAQATLKSVTLNYGAELRLAYVYDIAGVDPSSVELRIYDNKELSGEYKTTAFSGDYDGNSRPIFYSTGISAKDIADRIYMAPYYNGEAIGDVIDYSVLQYCYDVLYGESTKNDADLVALVTELMEYGAAAQTRLINIGNIPDETRIGDYIYVYVADRSITVNGRRSALVAPGEEVAISSANAIGYNVLYESGESEYISGKDVSFAPDAIACIEAVEAPPVVDFEGIEAGTAWAPEMTDDLTIKTVNQGASDTVIVRDQDGNKYLEYVKATSAKGILELWKSSETSPDETIIFHTNIRFTDPSNVNFASILFYIDGTYKTAYYPLGSSSTPYYISSADGNITLGGKDTGVAVGEWFNLAFKLTADRLEVLVNGKSFQVYSVAGIHNATVVRIMSVTSDRTYKIDFDDVYYGANDFAPAVEGFDGVAKDTAWDTAMTEKVTITNLQPSSTNVTVREENGNKYLEYDKHDGSVRGALRIYKTAETLENEPLVFEMRMRHTVVSSESTSAYFRFFNSKTSALGSNYLLVSKDAENGNLLLDGEDTGVKVGEWFTITFKFTTDTLEVLINGESFKTVTVENILTVYEVRLYNEPAMIHKTDIDDIYFGATIE